jgi:hypothetical protein
MIQTSYEIVVNNVVAFICHSEHERVECVGHLIEQGIQFIIR